jgi:porin
MNRWIVSLAGAVFFAIMLFALDGRLWAEETAPERAAEAALMDVVMETPLRPDLEPAAEVSQPQERFSREWWESRGVSVTSSYTAEGFTSAYGGAEPNHRAQYLGSVNTSLTLDFSKIGFARGQVFLSGQNIHGRGINVFGLGAVQAPSSLDNPTFTGLVEAFYSDTYLKERLSIKVGRQYADTEFDATENGGEFVNSSYGHIPTVPLPTYPYPSFGGSLWYTPTERISAGVGVYKGNYVSAQDPGDEAASPSLKEAFTIAEVQFRPLSSEAAHSTVIRLGAWQQARGAWLTNQGVVTATDPVRNYGVYATADYSFGKRSAEDRAPGLFFQFGWAPADRNAMSGYLGAGIAYPGLISRRRQDSAGLGVTQVKLSSGERESIVELFYKWQVNKNVFIQPDLQWVHSPAGDGRNALLTAVRLTMTL